MEISPEQIRAARTLLRLEQAELGKRAGVSVVTVRRLGRERVAPRILAKACAVLEQAGAEFIPDGIHRRRPERPDAATLYEDLRAVSLRSAARMLKQHSKI